MARALEDLDFLLPEPSRFEPTIGPSISAEREPLALSRIRDAISRVDADFRDPVSASLPPIEELESFADRIIRENIAKQAEPDIVQRNVDRFNRNLVRQLAEDTAYAPRAKTFRSQYAFADPSTVFGTQSYIRGMRFTTAGLSLPCVERSVRREVMFAKRKAGRGYRKRHRRGPFTHIWC